MHRPKLSFPFACFGLLSLLMACQTPAQQVTANASGPQSILVKAGQDLQAALDRARPGDKVLLQNGAVFSGTYRLGVKPGAGWIDVQPADMSFLPPAGTRVNRSHFAAMPKIIAINSDGALATNGPAHHFRFTGIEVGVKPGVAIWNLISIGTAQEKTVEQLPHDLVFDRMYVHGDEKIGGVRGFALNGVRMEVKNSHISDFKHPQNDCQTIDAWNTPGPLLIENNYLEASSENIMLGGSTPSIRGAIPSDVTIRRNHFFKPFSWRKGEANFNGTEWSVKNLFEIKFARKVLFDSNILENSWAQFQMGFAIVLTVRTENGAVPEAVVEDIQITNNVVRNVAGFVNFLGVDDAGSGKGLGKTRRITIRNNVAFGVSKRMIPEGSGPRSFQILNGAEDIEISNNTVVADLDHGALLVASGDPSPGLRFFNNLVSGGAYGLVGDGKPNGSPAMSHYFPRSTIRRNAVVGPAPYFKEFDSIMLDSYESARFTNLNGWDLRLHPKSELRGKGLEGKAIGADVEQVLAATAGVEEGIPADAVPAASRSLLPRAAVKAATSGGAAR